MSLDELSAVGIVDYVLMVERVRHHTLNHLGKVQLAVPLAHHAGHVGRRLLAASP